MLNFSDDTHMRSLERFAEKFYDNVLRPEEEPGFVSDEATLCDISLAPEELLVERIKAHYGTTVTRLDLQRSFWKLLTDLVANRIASQGNE